ncbi:MAG: hypothetical protein GQ540_12660 [Lutibacter sp.]|uniref:hypothetical protein n=1 Tax=Lutibacter sp. TaxID=1925666 RepID=UPI0019FBA205|nr:hypothetical protein [Lutibacter sp.]NOR29369.1 hypothetical protein [Lutibacter sp.]
MRTIHLKLLMAILIIGIALTACNNDDNDDGLVVGPEDITIAIDENQAFNMKNFSASFEQLFVSDRRPAWGFTHNYVNGKAIETYQNYKIHGIFGDKIFTIVHNFNTEGIIVSSQRLEALGYWESDAITFTYVYDLEGYIIKLTKTEDGEIRDVVNMEYDTNMQLIKKIHEALSGKIVKNKNEGGDEEWEELFTYDTEGNVLSYTNERWDDVYEYTYLNGNMVEEKEYYNGSLDDTYIFEYDSENRLVSRYRVGESEDRDTYEYTTNLMREIEYNDDYLDEITDYIEGLFRVKRWDFRYDNDDIFEYCRAKEYGVDEYITKKEYYEGTPDNLVLVGYSIIDSRDSSTNKKTKESIYNEAGTKIFYAEFVLNGSSIIETNWFDVEGNSWQTNDFSEEQGWIFILVR